MIIINNNINPDNSLYYAGALILEVFQLENNNKFDLILLFNKINNKIDLYNKNKRKNKKRSLPFVNYILALDWLFLLGVISEKEGFIEYVTR